MYYEIIVKLYLYYLFFIDKDMKFYEEVKFYVCIFNSIRYKL